MAVIPVLCAEGTREDSRGAEMGRVWMERADARQYARGSVYFRNRVSCISDPERLAEI